MSIINLKPIKELLTPDIEGYEITYLSNQLLQVAPGKCWDSSETFGLVLSDAATINFNANGANGLDVGVKETNKNYYIFVIGQQTGYSPVATLLSLSPDNPVMPVGYDLIRRIGVWRTLPSSAAFMSFIQSGNKARRLYKLNYPVLLLDAGAETTFTAIDVSGAFPVIDNLEVGLNLSLTPNTAGNAAYVQPFGADDVSLDGITGVVAAEVQLGQIKTLAKLDADVPKIEYKVTEATDALNITASYFIDNI